MYCTNVKIEESCFLFPKICRMGSTENCTVEVILRFKDQRPCQTRLFLSPNSEKKNEMVIANWIDFKIENICSKISLLGNYHLKPCFIFFSMYRTAELFSNLVNGIHLKICASSRRWTLNFLSITYRHT